MSNPFSEPFVTSFAAKIKDFVADNNMPADLMTKFRLIEKFASLTDNVINGSVIFPVPREISDLVNASNRIVSFLLDDAVHIGNGVLVGPAHVLTAAHIFFDQEGTLIEERRAQRLTVAARTTYLGNVVMDGTRRSVKIAKADTDAWSIEPKVLRGKAAREVATLDFAIVKLDEKLGLDPIGHELQRGWFGIPRAANAQVLSTDLAFRILQFLDRGPLLTSIGFIRSVLPDGSRVLHTASTQDSASGAPMVSSEFDLIGLHLGGSASGEQPKSNRGLPIRRVAEVIDAVRADGTTVRSELV